MVLRYDETSGMHLGRSVIASTPAVILTKAFCACYAANTAPICPGFALLDSGIVECMSVTEILL